MTQSLFRSRLARANTSGFGANAAAQNFLERHGAVAFHRQPPAVHLAEHAEDVEHRLVDAVAGERAEPGEVRMVLKLECPGESAFDIHAVALGQLGDASEARGGVARIHRPVAISERGPLTGGATFRIALANHG